MLFSQNVRWAEMYLYNSNHLEAPNSLRLKEMHKVWSNKKLMLHQSFLFYIKGIVRKEFVPQGQTVNCSCTVIFCATSRTSLMGMFWDFQSKPNQPNMGVAWWQCTGSFINHCLCVFNFYEFSLCPPATSFSLKNENGAQVEIIWHCKGDSKGNTGCAEKADRNRIPTGTDALAQQAITWSRLSKFLHFQLYAFS